MNFKTIERVSFLYGELKKIDTEVIQIEKLAQYLAENSVPVNFRMTASKPEKAEKVLDSDGSLIVGSSIDSLYKRMMGTGYSFLTSATPPKPDFELDYVLSDSVSLGILGVLLSEKHTRRAVITEELRGIFNMEK